MPKDSISCWLVHTKKNYRKELKQNLDHLQLELSILCEEIILTAWLFIQMFKYVTSIYTIGSKRNLKDFSSFSQDSNWHTNRPRHPFFQNFKSDVRYLSFFSFYFLFFFSFTYKCIQILIINWSVFHS